MQQKGNILIATMGLSIGGAETHIIELSKGLHAMGVPLFVASNGGAYEAELEALGIPHFSVPLHNKSPGNVVKAYMSLYRIIKENNIKLVHAHARIPAFLCGMLQKRMDYRFRLVTTAHFNFINIFPYNLLTNWGERTLAVSEDLADYLIKNYKTPREKITITVNGIDINKFTPEKKGVFPREFNIPADAVKVICVTRLDKEPSKIVPILAEAALILYNTNNKIRVIIIGDGNNKKAAQAAADMVNAKVNTDIVILAGARTDIPDILPYADIFVGISRAALEAMAAARPVILAGGYGYIGRFDENTPDTALKTNFTCRGGEVASPEVLANDILAYLNEPMETREKNGIYGRDVVKKHYSVARMCTDAVSVYEAAFNSPSLRRKRRNDVLLFGYYGSGNNGDDVLLKSILDDLKATDRCSAITVLSRRPRETARIHGINAVYLFNIPLIIKTLKNTELLISGGGTLLQDVTSTRSLIYYLTIINRAKRYNTKVMLYANGIGPVLREKNKTRIKKALADIDCITLRDTQSLNLINELGIKQNTPAVLTADAAFSLNIKKSAQPRITEKKYFIAALRRWKYLAADFVEVSAAFCDFLYDTYGLTAVYLPMQPSEDTAILKKIMNTSRSPGIFFDENRLHNTNEILSLTAGAEFVYSMRLHTIIYAAKAYVPAIAVVYDPKVLSMMNILAQDTYAHAETISISELKTHSRYIMENRAAISEKIKEKASEQTELAKININYAKELL